MKTAIVIINYNGLNLIKKFMPSIITNSSNYNIYVIDNNSTDDSVNYIKNNFSNINIINNSSNLGYAGGYNEGIKKIDEDLLVFLNNDATFLDENSLSNLVKVFKENSEIKVAQPKIIDFTNQEKFEYSGAAGGFIDFFGYPFCRGRIFSNVELKNNYNTTREVFWASGTCFAVRKSTFVEHNGFDESFFAHMEEIDLCWRIKRKNIDDKIVAVGNSEVYHLGGGSLTYNSSNKYYLNFRNSIIMMIKNIPGKYFFQFLLGRLFLDFLILIFSIITLKFNLFIGIVKAYLFLLINLLKIKRVKFKNERIFKYYYCKSIIFNYLLRRKNKFSKI
ncbi:MAG: dTDP-Rha--alpha-D-GlcNAc-pyrophosphate polyprenol alpha-3-L-rhamnosyltransferase [Flavobacteriaceae bacterium]|nr:dTDP-Rha--alpha-D-GlcNAc-pyrophosphate polyprenol alpha-3-L-rhamnosyltransferase [Flavobacteriaceae bacterium]|tara:strand:- start:2948 stop:3946 length:999 start_codon:yes stop_codon:yes gene_type:complete